MITRMRERMELSVLTYPVALILNDSDLSLLTIPLNSRSGKVVRGAPSYSGKRLCPGPTPGEMGEMSDRELQSILDSPTVVIQVRDASGRYLRINRRFEETFGLGRSQILGKTDYNCFQGRLPVGSAPIFWW